MKLNKVKRPSSFVKILDVSAGEVFIFKGDLENSLYMKITDLSTGLMGCRVYQEQTQPQDIGGPNGKLIKVYRSLSELGRCAYIRIADGNMFTCRDDEEVTVVECTLDWEEP